MMTFDEWYDSCMRLQSRVRLTLIEAEKTIVLFKVELLDEHITYYRIWDRNLPTLDNGKIHSQDTARKIYKEWLKGVDIGTIKKGDQSNDIQPKDDK